MPDLNNSTANFTLLNAFDDFFGGISQVNTIAFSCYYGVYEVKTLVDRYLETFTNPSTLLFNLYFNAGTSISSVRNLLLYFMKPEFSRVKTPRDFGNEIGQMLWYNLYPQKSYIDRVLANGGTFQQDWTWTNLIN